MRTISFYSFKGGVGRSMALVNIGVWLAKQGRRVLLVDFDLEAPGLEHYELPRPKTPAKGVVDYIYEHIYETTPKSLDGYYYECTTVGTKVDSKEGALYLMPAGRQSTYRERLNKINFEDLYSEFDGFLLLENLKHQWAQEIAPDYVLIDSRTGHNDVAGICTRQLPDIVVTVLFPSSQNIHGLKQILREIRAQNDENWRTPIQIEFVASNIPAIDDENDELATAMAAAKKELGINEFLGVVHHYPSLSHMRQVVFTDRRLTTRLSEELVEIGAKLLTIGTSKN